MNSPSVRRRGRFEAILALCLLLLLTACSHLGPLGRLGSPFFSDPEFRFENVGISNVSFTGFTLGFQVDARNPNRFPITVSNWQYAVSLNKMVFLEGTVDDKVKIPGKSTKRITIPVEVSYRNVSKIIKGAIDRRTLAYDFRSDFDLATWLGSGSAPFQSQGEIAMPKQVYVGRGLLEGLLGGRKDGGGVIDERDLERWKRDYEERMRERSR